MESLTRVCNEYNSKDDSCVKVGSLFDDGAPYKANGELKRHIIIKILIYSPSIMSNAVKLEVLIHGNMDLGHTPVLKKQ